MAAASWSIPSPSSPAAAAAPLTLTTSSCTTETAKGKHVFNVHQYSLLKGLAVGKFVRSGVFNVGGHDWAVRYYPSGWYAAADGQRQDASVYLELVIPNAGVRAVFDLRLVDQATGRSRSVLPEGAAMAWHQPHHHGAAELPFRGTDFKRSELETPAPAYVQDDRLTIICDITVIKHPTVSETRPLPRIDAPPRDMAKDLGKLLENKEATDVTVVVDGKAFRAHRAMLAARSPALSKKLKESSPGSTSIPVDGVRPAVFKALLHFIYTDTLPRDMEEDLDGDDDKTEMLWQLLAAAERFAVERLKGLCESILSSKLDMRPWKTLMALAEQHGCDKLKAACTKYALVCTTACGTNSTEACKNLKRNPPVTTTSEACKHLKKS